MFTMTPPIVFTESARKLLAAVKSGGYTPVEFEVLFGPESIEMLDRDVLRSVTTLTELFGLPIRFPEEPGPRERLVWVALIAAPGVSGANLYIAPEVLNSSY